MKALVEQVHSGLVDWAGGGGGMPWLGGAWLGGVCPNLTVNLNVILFKKSTNKVVPNYIYCNERAPITNTISLHSFSTLNNL